MLKLNGGIDYDRQMDPECIPLCDALNAIKGIDTFDSCCGHGTRQFMIFFTVTDWVGLFFLARCVDKRYWKYGAEWCVELSVGDYWDEETLPTHFWLHSNSVIGEEAYEQANNLVENMNLHLNHEAFREEYKIPDTLFNTVDANAVEVGVDDERT